MPPRKSDQRKGDVSSARFALKDNAAAAPETPSQTSASPAPPAAPATPAAAPATPSAPAEATKPADAPGSEPPAASDSQQGDSPSQDKKDKDKDKDSQHRDPVTIEELALPKSIITRLAKGVLPANTQIQANAVLALSKSTTVFISHIAAYANDHTLHAGKKTISPSDVFKALEDAEFGAFKERCEAEFAKFNAINTDKRNNYRAKVKAKPSNPDKSDLSMIGGNTTLTDADTTMADNSIVGGNTTLNLSVEDSTMADASTVAPAAGSSTKQQHQQEASGPRAKKPRVDAAVTVADTEEEDADDVDDEPEEEDEAEDDDVEEDDDEDEDRPGSGDETQDAVEDKDRDDEPDEALDGDESD